MKLFKVAYQLSSAIASDWQSDTIFGHLCWALRYLEGDDSLIQFLKQYEQGQPPIIVSNGFPADLLPRPITALIPLPKRQKISVKQQIDDFKANKETGEVSLLTPQEFAQVIRGEEVLPSLKMEQLPSKRSTLKNQINRLTGTTGAEGNLFEFEETIWSYIEGDKLVDIPISIYIKIREGFVEQAERLFSFIATQGYGKRKSAGYGQISSHRFEEFPGFASPQDANGFVSLSNFVPARGDPREGTWQTIIKYGKLGEEFAIGDNPFKRPLLMFTAGSCFYHAPCKEYCGRMVDDIAPSHPEIVQYGLAFPVPIKLPQKEEYQ